MLHERGVEDKRLRAMGYGLATQTDESLCPNLSFFVLR